MLFGGGNNRTLMQIELMLDEFIRVHCFDIVLPQRFIREIFQVERNHSLRTCSNGGGKDMTIIDVRQFQTFNKRLIASNQSIWHGTIHKLSRAVKYWL